LSASPTTATVPVALAIGGNLGDRAATLRDAVRRLVAGGVMVDAVSSLYETPPWGYAEQPPFLNGAVRGRTALSPHGLLALAKQIEHDLGRLPTFRNGPRPVDIDIALYDDQIIDEPEIQIPHPGLPERAFVLVPLAEVAGRWVHPPTGKTIADLRAALGPADEITQYLAPARWAYITPETGRQPKSISDTVIDSSTHPTFSARILSLHSESEYHAEMQRIGINGEPARLVQRVGYAVVQVAQVEKPLAEQITEIVNGLRKVSHSTAAHGTPIDIAAAVSDEEHAALIVRGTLLGLMTVAGLLEHSAVDFRGDEGKKRTANWQAVGQSLRLAVQRHDYPPATVTIGKHTFDWTNRVVVMGILNATPDSFSDAGKYSKFDDALCRAYEMAEQGATMIEVGGQSAQPGTVISVDEELARIVPLLERLRDEIGLPLAVDTFRVGVARGAVAAGAVYINDIGGGGDEGDGMARLAAETGVLLGIMHLRGRPKEKQWETDYASVMDEVTGFLHERIGRAVKVGVAREKIVIDPGLGFGKEAPHDLEIMHRFAELRSFGLPILLATSRKNYLSDTVGGTVHDLLPETAAAVTYGITQGASIIRVHDVAFMARIARLMPHILRHTGGD
jgi:dihydropteroate synthase